MEVRQRDAAVHGVPPVGEFVVRVEPRVKVLFAVFKLHKESEPTGNKKTGEQAVNVASVYRHGK